MLYLFISIFCSVFVGILFKKIKPNFTEGFLMIATNYLIAIILSYYLFDVNVSSFDLNYYIVIPLVILMPTVFYFMNISINKSGIIKTDIAQRISLIIPISASFLIFGESISAFKWIGIILGFCSVVLMLYKNDNTVKFNSIYLILVFLGYGIIDILFKQIAIQKSHPYTTYLFFVFTGCFFTSLIMSLFIKKSKINKKIFLYGCILGILNFSNIFFYLKAHKIYNNQPSTVFAVMNFGVISLATILGVFLFKERLSKKNIFGLILAVFAIIFVLYSQFKNI